MTPGPRNSGMFTLRERDIAQPHGRDVGRAPSDAAVDSKNVITNTEVVTNQGSGILFLMQLHNKAPNSMKPSQTTL